MVGRMTQSEAIGLDRVAFGYVAAGTQLAAMGITFQAGLRTLSLTNVGSDNIYMVYDDVPTTANFVLLPGDGVTLRILSQTASGLYFNTAEGEVADMNVQQEGVVTQ